MTTIPETFEGRGEMKGHTFKRIKESDYAFVYELTDEEGFKHYETFEKKINTQYDCISYPRSTSFGKWAWCFKHLDPQRALLQAIERYDRINLEQSRKTLQ
jgi:hypothetical protein